MLHKKVSSPILKLVTPYARLLGAHTPYLCPEARITIDPAAATTDKRMNVSQMSYEWPALFLDTVEWVQHHNKTGVFFHEENIFSLWTMKV